MFKKKTNNEKTNNKKEKANIDYEHDHNVLTVFGR